MKPTLLAMSGQGRTALWVSFDIESKTFGLPVWSSGESGGRPLLEKWVPKVIYLCNLYRSDPELLWFWLNSSWKHFYLKCSSFSRGFLCVECKLAFFMQFVFAFPKWCFGWSWPSSFRKVQNVNSLQTDGGTKDTMRSEKTRLIFSSGQLKRIKATYMYISSIIPACSSKYDIIYTIISHNTSQYCNTWC